MSDSKKKLIMSDEPKSSLQYRGDIIKKNLRKAIERIKTIDAPTYTDEAYLKSIVTLLDSSVDEVNTLIADEEEREYWKGYNN